MVASLIWTQYSIDLPGIPFWDFCHLKIASLGRDNGSFNSSNTDVVEKVHFLVAASQHVIGELRWRKDPLST